MPKVELILAPVDFSAVSDSAAAYARGLAARLGARLRLVHAVPARASLACAGEAEPAPDSGRAARDRAARDLGDLAGRMSRGPQGEPRVETEIEVIVDGERSPADAIVRAARIAGADLIVMATHGRSPVRRILVGSVTEDVARMAPCPVLTVR